MTISDAASDDVRIEIEIVTKGLAEAEARLQSLQEKTGHVNTAVNRMEATVRKANDQLAKIQGSASGAATGLGKLGSSANSSRGDVEDVTSAVQKLREEIAKVNNEHIEFSVGQVTGDPAGTDALSLSRAEQDRILAADKALRTSAVSAIKEQRTEEEKAAEAQLSFLDQIAASHARNATRRREEDAADRAAQAQAISGAKELSRAEEKAAKRREQDNIYNDYLTHQDEAKQAAKERAQILEETSRAEDRVAAATARRVGLERANDRSDQKRREAAELKEWAEGERRLTSAIEERNAAQTRIRAVDEKVALSHLSPTDAARVQLGRAQGGLNSAQAQLNAVKPGDLAGQASAYTNLANAKERVQAATLSLNAAQQNELNSLPRLRYALYDVAATYGTLSAALLAADALIIGTAGSFESSFTNVERTLEPAAGGVAGIREELVDLSTQIPLTFGELSQIATLGNQLGVEADNISSFTSTVARFSAVAGVSVDETAQAFGGMSAILNVSEEDYERLGSAIALVGRRSVATEGEILSLTREVGQQAHQAGFSADQVIGLAGALGELRLPPERSRGALTTYFQTLNMAVAEGGQKLEDFARIVGVSSGELDHMVRSGQGVEIFQRFLASLNSADDVVDITSALDNLGLSQLRVSDVFQRLGANADIFNQSLANGAEGWSEGSELARQYEMVLDDLNTQFQLLWQSVLALFDAAGGDLLPGLSGAISGLRDFVNVLREWVDTPVGAWIVKTMIAMTAIIGAYAAYKTASALATAAAAALVTANRELATSSLTAQGGLRGLITMLFGLQGSAGKAAASTGAAAVGASTLGTTSATASGGVTLLARSVAMLTKATIVLAIIGLLVNVLMDLRGTALSVIDVTEWFYNSIAKWTLIPRIITGIIGGINALAGSSRTGLGSMVAGIQRVIGFFGAAGRVVQNTVAGFFAWARGVVRAVVGAAQSIAAPLQGLVDMVAGAAQAAANVLAPLIGTVKTFLGGAGNSFMEFDKQMAGGFDMARDWAKTLPSTYSEFDELSSSVLDTAAAFDMGTGAGGDLSDALGDVGDGAGGAAAQLRTVMDYANDLKGVFDRSFELRFGNQQALDSISSSWARLADEQEAARQSIAEYRAELQSLSADKSTLEFWLTVAEGYNDTLRADKIRAELAETNNKITKTTGDLSKAQDTLNGSTEGNSSAAIANRAALYDLAGQYQALLVSYANTGMSQAELEQKSRELKEEFLRQAAQLGFTGVEVERLAAHFDSLAIAIQHVPRNVDIEVDANIDPALQAIREVRAAAESLGNSSYPGPSITGGYVSPATKDAMFTAWVNLMQQQYGRALSHNAEGWATVRRNWENGMYGQFYDGGYTGGGNPRDIAGIVHKKEYVSTAATTAKWGVNTFDAMRDADSSTIAAVKALLGVGGLAFQQSAPAIARVFTGGPARSSGPQEVRLSQYDRMLLEQIAESSGLVLTGASVQSMVGTSNADTSRRRVV